MAPIHSSALIRQDAEHYRRAFPEGSDDQEYVWPVRSEAVIEAERRKPENAALRTRRAPARAEEAAERDRRRRSRAAESGWRIAEGRTPTPNA